MGATRQLHNRYTEPVRTISQRELRNDSGQVLREAEQGEEFTVTRRGTPVARVVPYNSVTGRRPALKPATFAVTDLVRSTLSSEQVLDDLRGE